MHNYEFSIFKNGLYSCTETNYALCILNYKLKKPTAYYRKEDLLWEKL